jgi:hypothetical protein
MKGPMRRSTLALALVTTVFASAQLHAQQYVLGPDLTFAGKTPTWLYISENGKLFRRPVKVQGNSIADPIKPPPNRRYRQV